MFLARAVFSFNCPCYNGVWDLFSLFVVTGSVTSLLLPIIDTPGDCPFNVEFDL